MIPKHFQRLQPDQPTPLYHQLEIALRRSIEAVTSPMGGCQLELCSAGYAITLTLPQTVTGDRSILEGDETTTDGPERLAAWQLISV